MKFKVWRSGRDGNEARYETYEVMPTPGMSVLEALFAIQDKYDDGLAFRYSCRGAVCGSCAMTINREMRLACRTQLSQITKMKGLALKPFPALSRPELWDRATEVLIEPLPNLPILKDLVVDMTRFYRAYKEIRPWLVQKEGEASFSKVMPEEAARIERYANCILCAACFGACPVCETDKSYVGPAALSWSFRFLDDVRAVDGDERLARAGREDGAPACELIYNCVKVCPKNVAPGGAIRVLKERLARGKDPP